MAGGASSVGSRWDKNDSIPKKAGESVGIHRELHKETCCEHYTYHWNSHQSFRFRDHGWNIGTRKKAQQSLTVFVLPEVLSSEIIQKKSSPRTASTFPNFTFSIFSHLFWAAQQQLPHFQTLHSPSFHIFFKLHSSKTHSTNILAVFFWLCL